MKISDEKVVSLIYKLLVDGEVADQTDRDNPLEFIFGLGYLIPKFEENISGLEPGDKFEFTLAPKDGYGEYVEDAVIDLPKKVFEVDGKVQENLLVPGRIIRMMNQEGGVVPGKVVSIDEESVKMDFNAPMAGKTLNFSGEIVSVRDATDAELTNGLHGERTCSQGECGHCSCDCH
ncbi:MAG: peptidylprolyl isomerase [Bacteroidales bacterium]|jgi:FKBP-type peptidyl-prolyl cis-trans isomerase SlyD|nr:peptidylprolyl isomerase [Bacteroidales bacterium]MCI2122166.1 peptidylprolyl isomerase [Bacteroidales bacterium]MCI2144686.1 peptidylprolyl isomerase [Bacteroidales bacterium]